MNVGLTEAHDLAERISAVVKGAAGPDSLEHYQTERQKQWQSMLGLAGGPKPAAGGAEWSARHADRILPCLPASGEDLKSLLGQLGLELM